MIEEPLGWNVQQTLRTVIGDRRQRLIDRG